jgi:hypothetical protein
MSTQTAEDLHYCIVVTGAPVAGAEVAAARFAEILGLDTDVSLQIVKSAPIRFLADATKAELQVLRPKLLEASRVGITFRITLESDTKIPNVNWPVRPTFEPGSSAGLQPVVEGLPLEDE